MGIKISDKELSRILRQPGYSVGMQERKPKPSTAHLLPQGSKHELHFMRLWESLDGPELTREHRFVPNRKFRFDFAYIPQRVAIECEGFGHSRQNRYTSDVEKYNLAALEGWKVYRLTGEMINVIELQKVINFIKAKEAK